MHYVLNNIKDVIVAGAITYLWSITGAPIGYSLLMPFLRDFGLSSSGVLYGIIKKLVRNGLIEGVNVGRFGTRIRYRPTRILIIELMLSCPWELGVSGSDYGTGHGTCFDIVFDNLDKLKNKWKKDDIRYVFIEWLEAITAIGTSSIESPLREWGYPGFFWNRRAIIAYWRSRDEYIESLKGLLSDLSDKWSELFFLSEFRDEHVKEYVDFLKWLVGEDVGDQDLPARVVYCIDAYTKHFRGGIRYTSSLQHASEIIKWLGDEEDYENENEQEHESEDEKEFKRLREKALERAKMDYKSFCDSISYCLNQRYRMRKVLLNSKQQ